MSECRFVQATSGWRRMVPVEVHGRVDQRGVERRGVVVRRVGDDQFGLEFEPFEIGGDALQPLRRTVERGDARATQRQLRGLAARRGAEIDHPVAGRNRQQARGQGGGGVLHPPFPFRKPFELRNRRVGFEPHRSRRQHHSAEPARPILGIALDRQIQRRRLAGAPARSRASSPRRNSRSSASASHGGTSSSGIGVADDLGLGARDVAQHRVGQRDIRRARGIGAHGAHGEIDGRVVGGFEKQHLRGGADQRRFERAGLARHALFEKAGERLADRAEPPHRHGGDGPRQRLVAGIEHLRRRFAVKRESDRLAVSHTSAHR